jgi:hypothetical protein
MQSQRTMLHDSVKELFMIEECTSRIEGSSTARASLRTLEAALDNDAALTTEGEILKTLKDFKDVVENGFSIVSLPLFACSLGGAAPAASRSDLAAGSHC